MVGGIGRMSRSGDAVFHRKAVLSGQAVKEKGNFTVVDGRRGVFRRAAGGASGAEEEEGSRGSQDDGRKWGGEEL